MECLRTLMLIVLLPLGVSGQSLLGPAERDGLVSALGKMEMSLRDLSFHKDVAEPKLLYEWTREYLADPLQLPARADRLSDALAGGQVLPFSFIANMMEAPFETGAVVGEFDVEPFSWEGWPDGKFPVLVSAIQKLVTEAMQISELVGGAFAGVSEADRGYLAASIFSSAMNAEDRPEVYGAVLELPIPKEVLDGCIEEGLVVDPAPYVQRFIHGVSNVQRGLLIESTMRWRHAVEQLKSQIGEVDTWPWGVRLVETPLGDVYVGTESDDVYSTEALLVIDPAGNDEYIGPVGVANGLIRHPLAAILDLAGRDVYRSDALLGPGSGLFGVSVLFDEAGNDSYDMTYCGAAAGIFGAAWIVDAGGNDRYHAEAFGQAAGVVGIGVLDDGGGKDAYDLGYSGQGYAGIMGFGLLVDREGNDRYVAGGVRPDYERHDDRYLSLAQGFSIGGRPALGGGFAALVDQGGNDAYVADIYGQGVGYWYAVGMLLDESGNDSYQLHQYGQGSGIHLSCGLLADRSGDDVYSGYVLTQGNAHDYGVGMLLEGGGEDTYTADHHSQGRALNNALGILIDSAGNDAYFSRQCDRSQGIGNDGDTREYGSLALLIDLAGEDQYNCGGRDGQSVLRPNFGIIYDVGEEVEE